ncbi:UNVERIFIED_CONTAM: MLO-like protein 1 [Sesamum radiatum]|uniref:MLO-like protein n=1 Tax=Sesamum radiatum TaxID=300843 RepID=A0AAW2TGF4_SESRA
MAAGGGGEGASLEYTPTWVVALVCTVIVAISLAAERILHFAGKNQQNMHPKHLMNHWLPCNKQDSSTSKHAKSTAHFEAFSFVLPSGTRHLLAAASDTTTAGYCDAKGKAPLLSLKALHDLHIFIFVLAVSHVVFSALTILFGGLRIQQWRHWEDSIQKELNDDDDPEEGTKTDKITHVQDHAFFRSKFSSGIGRLPLFGWLISILKQFYGSVEKSDYRILRRGFIRLLVGVGAKLEHIMRQLAEEVAQKHTAVIGEPEVEPSDRHFWFHRPRIVLVLIHVVLFQNAFEIAVFFWMLFIFGFDSCIMGQIAFIIPRLVIGVFVQLLCSYSTLPLYAIVAQMGSSFNVAIFEEHIQAGLVGWAQKAKKNKQKVVEGAGAGAGARGSSSSNYNQVAHHDSPFRSVEMSTATTTNQVQNSSSEIMIDHLVLSTTTHPTQIN